MKGECHVLVTIRTHHKEKSASIMILSMLILFPFSVWPDKTGAEPSSSHCGTGYPGSRRWIWPPRVTSERWLLPRLHRDSDRAPDHRHFSLSAAGLHHVWQERGSVCIHFFIYPAVSAILKNTFYMHCFFSVYVFSTGKKEMQEQTSKYTWLHTVNKALKLNSVCSVLSVRKCPVTKYCIWMRKFKRCSSVLQNPAVPPPHHPRERRWAQEHGWKPRCSATTVHTAHVQQPDRRRGSSTAVRQPQHSPDHGPVVSSQPAYSLPSILIVIWLALLNQFV